MGEGVSYRKALLKGQNASKYFYDYKFTNSYTELVGVDNNICGVVEDWDDNSVLYLECMIDNNSTVMHFEQEGNDWDKTLTSDDDFKVLELYQDNNIYSCLFTSTGSVVYGGSEIFNGSGKAVHRISINKNGEFQQIESGESTTNENQSIFYDLNGDNCRILLNNSSSTVTVNGASQEMSSGERALISLCDNGETEFFSRIWTSSNMKISDCAVSSDGSNTFVTFVGKGQIKINGTRIFNSSNKYGVVVTLDQVGNYVRKKVVGAIGIVNDQIKITAKENGTQYVGFTLDRQRTLGGQILNPAGQSDIVVAGLTNQGSWYDVEIYGSNAEEELEDIVLSSNHLFISGKAGRGVDSRIIGDVELFTMDIDMDFPFIATKEINIQQAPYSSQSEVPDGFENINIEIVIAPTVSNNEISISIVDPEDLLTSEALIINSHGKIIRKITIKEVHRETINELPAGLYFIQFMGKDSRSYLKRFIKSE